MAEKLANTDNNVVYKRVFGIYPYGDIPRGEMSCRMS